MCNQTSYKPMQGQGLPLSDNCQLIHNAAFLNREGATFLISGDLDNAIRRLNDALAYLFQANGFQATPSIGSAYLSRSFPFGKDVPRYAPSCTKFHLQQEMQRLASDCDDGSYFVYSNPFIFHPILVDTPDYAINCASVVMFNLALAFHQRGRLADSRALYRAQTLYDMSLSLVAQLDCQAACENLQVAATNNKAHIQFEVSNVGDAKTTLHDLLNILSATNNRDDSTPPPFGEVEIEKFYMNILHLNGSTLAGAA